MMVGSYAVIGWAGSRRLCRKQKVARPRPAGSPEARATFRTMPQVAPRFGQPLTVFPLARACQPYRQSVIKCRNRHIAAYRMDGKSVSGVVPDSSAQALPLVDGSTTAESSMVTPWSAPVSAPELSPSSAPAPLYTSFGGTDAWDTPGRLGAARHAHSGEPPVPKHGHWARQTRTRGLERSNGPPPKLPATPRALYARCLCPSRLRTAGYCFASQGRWPLGG